SGGGQLNDSGSHLLDIILWITGLAVTEVFAFINHRGAPVDINSAISLRFDNGSEGNVSVVGDARAWWEDLTLWGENGAFFYRNGRLFEQMGDAQAREVTDLPHFSNPDQNFIYAILGKEEPQAPGICGLRVIELTEAAWRSGSTGAPARVERAP
ncbi:MAG: gfo/Idh/MocA family oxidoreductase, partial [Armatimonadota bacterium]|nr:gfo/Idh/MocA family oxidoreductase [Armatimonadota bacterium]